MEDNKNRNYDQDDYTYTESLGNTDSENLTNNSNQDFQQDKDTSSQPAYDPDENFEEDSDLDDADLDDENDDDEAFDESVIDDDDEDTIDDSEEDDDEYKPDPGNDGNRRSL